MVAAAVRADTAVAVPGFVACEAGGMCLRSPPRTTMVPRRPPLRRKAGRDTGRGHALPVSVYWLLLLLLLSLVIVCKAYDFPRASQPHACRECSRTFSVLAALRRHHRRHHPGVPFWQHRGGSPSAPDTDATPEAAPLGAQPAEPSADGQPAPPPSAPGSSCPDVDPGGLEAVAPNSVAGRILEYYRKWGDRATARPIVEHVPGGRPDQFNTPALKKFRSFALSVGGSGLSGPDRELLWDNLVTAERQAREAAGVPHGKGPLETAFPSGADFKASLKKDADRCMQDLNWMVADIKMDSQTVPFYYRDLMAVLVDAAQSAPSVILHGERRVDADGNVVRSGTLDSDIFLSAQKDVAADARYSGMQKKFVMAVQLFSDAALVSWSRAHHMYPIRARFPNIETGLTQWVTVGYLPFLKPRHAMTRTEENKLRVQRNQLQQRCLAVLMDRFIEASRDGEAVVLRQHGLFTVFPRVCLYVADLPEERHVLGLMLNRCMRMCSFCLATKDEVGSPDLCIEARSVASTLAVQMEAALLFDAASSPGRVSQIAAMLSATPFVPILGAVYGLGTGSMALFDAMCFDNLHVLKLGLLCSLGHKIPDLLAVLCHGGLARYGTVGNTLVEANERVLLLGRLCKAIKDPPGSLVPSLYKQATMTGNNWRYAVAYWPSMVAGLFERRHHASVAPCAATAGQQSRYGGAKLKEKKKRGGKRARSSSPADDKSLADLVAGCSDCSDAEVDGGPVPVPNTSERTYSDAFGNMPVCDAVLELVCRAAALTGRLCGDNCMPLQTISESAAVDTAKEAYRFVTLYVAALLGEMHHSKLHRLAYHRLAALLNHGNLVDGDTSANEALHKLCKRMYARTNKKKDDYTLQMLRAEQALSKIINEALSEQTGGTEALEDCQPDAPEEALEDWTGGELLLPDEGDEDSDGLTDDDGVFSGYDGDGAGAAAAEVAEPSIKRRRVRGRRAQVGDIMAAAEGGVLSGLSQALGVSNAESLVVRKSVVFCPTLEWGASLARQRIHADDSNNGAPWYDFFRYRDAKAPTNVQHGMARLVIFGVGDVSRRAVVVQRLQPADTDAGCVRSRFGFRRLQWDIAAGADVPTLEVVDLQNVLRLEQVEPDFVPMTAKHGLFYKPASPTTVDEWRDRRFFTNPFHSWTSTPLGSH